MPQHVRSHLRSLQLKNFRRFEDTGLIDLRPITLIIGKNSSGKTSLLRSALLLKQLSSIATFEEVPLGGPLVDFGSYREIVYEGQLERNVEIQAVIDLENISESYGRSFRAGPLGALMQGVTLDVVMHWNKQQQRPQYNKIELTALSDRDVGLAFTRRGPKSFTLDTPAGRTTVNRPLSFAAIRQYPSRLTLSQPKLEERVDLTLFILFEALTQAMNSIRHVAPLRDMPDRAYRLDQLSPESPTATVVNILERQRDAQKLMSQALRDMGMAREVSLKTLAPGYVGIVLTDPVTGRADNLTDVGFGVSQVLPVIAAVATAAPGTALLIEQPELHLHPEAQGRLADVLVTMARLRGATLVIETHSEHILLRLMRRIAEGTADSKEVRVLCVNDGVVQKLGIDEFGRLTGGSLPPGFFEEDWEDTIELTKAASKRAKG